MQQLSKPHLPALLHLIRKRVARFQVMLPGHIVYRVRNRITFLRSRIAPAVLHVFIRTLLNGWPTQRRMRSMTLCDLELHCPFCLEHEDSIEHFSSCHIITAHYQYFGCSLNDLAAFIVLDQESFPRQTVKRTILLASVYAVV